MHVYLDGTGNDIPGSDSWEYNQSGLLPHGTPANISAA